MFLATASAWSERFGSTMKTAKVSRWLRGFDASGELKAEYRLPDSWNIERLRTLFETPENDLMFHSYPAGPQQVAVLGEDIGQDLASRQLEFFLEADSEE